MEQCVLYARVSSKEQEREGYSIPAQIELLEKYAYRNNLKIVETFIDVETAKQSGRTNFEKMLAFLKKNKTVRDVLVEKTDRLYRNLPDYVTIDGLHLNLHLVKEGVLINDNSHSSEKFMHLIKVGMAKQYIDNLSEEVRKGISQKCYEGHYPAKAPIGYLNVTSPTKKKIIVPDTNTSHYIKKCFERYASGLYSYKSLAKKMTEDGFTINGNPVRKHNIENILENPIYYGDFIYKGKQYEGKHEPIISRELFIICQQRKRLQSSPKIKTHEFPYSNMIKCSECGCYLVGEIKKKKYIYYHCTGNKGGTCKKHYIRQEVIEKAIAEVLKLIEVNSEEIIEIKDTVKELLKMKEDYEEDKAQSIMQKISRTKTRLNKLYTDKIDGLIDEDFYFEMRNKYQSELDELHVVFNAMTTTSKYFIEDITRMLELCKNAHSLYLSETDEEKRKLVNLLCSNLSFDGSNIRVELKSVFNIFIENASRRLNLGRNVEVRTFDRAQKIAEALANCYFMQDYRDFFECVRIYEDGKLRA